MGEQGERQLSGAVTWGTGSGRWCVRLANDRDWVRSDELVIVSEPTEEEVQDSSTIM